MENLEVTVELVCGVCGCAVADDKVYNIIINGNVVRVCYDCYKEAMGDDYWA